MRDFVRGALLDGLRESERIGVNPFRLGIIASTDTHNGTPGAVAERSFLGHRGLDDDTPALQLGHGGLTPGGLEFSPGGLAAVWAEENSRPAIFDALRRREVVRHQRAAPGGALLRRLAAPRRPLRARRSGERGLPARRADGRRARRARPVGERPRVRGLGAARCRHRRSPGRGLQRAQIVKGWVDGGELHEQVFDVAGDANNGATVDTATCTPSGPGADSLCARVARPGVRPRAARLLLRARPREPVVPLERVRVQRARARRPAARVQRPDGESDDAGARLDLADLVHAGPPRLRHAAC